MELTKETALQFALIISSGMPHSEAIRYFCEPEEEPFAKLKVWSMSPLVAQATLSIQKKSWQDMTLSERIKCAIDLHYSQMAYFLYSHNYVEVAGTDKQKADTCRQALEAKLAGMAGKMDALTSFWSDVANGTVKLPGVGLPA